jgi:EAL domain-containing protein (putative c-di-GMP-specific phosphodiesterase class I)
MDDVFISPCVGISVYPEDGPSADGLIGNAVAATEHAQTMGRNTYRFYSRELNQATIERLKLEAHLRRARERGELHIAYQPKVDNRTGRIVGAEALLRWRHSELGPIGPDRFIPIAEETGLIVELGIWVLDQACAQLRRWTDDGLGHLKVAVNVSRHELQAGGVVQAIQDALKRHRLSGTSLILELTESVLVDRLDATSQQLEEIRRLGVQISIDDFGTGYSSMNYIKHFPLDELKIDRSFVSGLPHEISDMAIVRAMVVLGQSLGMRVVAEGIEDPEQLTAVQVLGIDQSQGYMLGRPLAPAEFAELARVFELRPQTLPGGLAAA